MTNELKGFAIGYIIESNNTKEEKKQFLKFVNEASDKQIKHLLINGMMVNENDVDKDIDITFSKTIPEKLLDEGVGTIVGIYAGITVAIMMALVAKVVYNVTKTFATKAGRACRKYTGNENAKCVAKFKQEAAKKKLAVLKQAKSKCNKTKEPKKCIALIDKKIQKAKKEVTVLIP